MKVGMIVARGKDIKQENRVKVRKCFYDGDILTKNMIIGETGFSNGAVTNILKEFIDEGEILLLGEAESTGGRKSKQYNLNRDHIHLLNVIIKRATTTNEIALTIVDLKGKPIESRTYYAPVSLREKIMESIGEVVKQDPLIKIVSISIPGVAHRGVITICDCEALIHWPIEEAIRRSLHLEVRVENDVNAACIGFYQGHQDSLAVAFLYQPMVKYVGCGMVLNHRLFKGANSFAGELSYLPFVDPSSQDKLLEADPQGLLKTQLVSLCCVVNPDVVGVCSDNFEGLPDWDLQECLPKTHVPKLVWVGDFYGLVSRGLYATARDYLVYNEN